MNKFCKILLSVIFVATINFAQSTPYVILVSFDAFRWDYVNREITPSLREVMTKGVHALSLRPVFPSKTFPNHYSIITGMYSENHGIIANGFLDTLTNVWYSMSDTVTTRESKWYTGEPFWTAAEKHGIKTASYFWPGSEQTDSLRHPTYFKKYEHNKPYFERVDSVISWLQLPQNVRPHFITIYFHDTDSFGHEFGPDSDELNRSVMRLDSVAQYLLTCLKKINMIDSVNVIFTSDHGMTPTPNDQVINIEKYIENYNCKIYDNGPVVRVEPEANEIDTVFQILKRNANNFRVYKKENLPSYYHYSNNTLISSIILIADLGWSLEDNEGFKRSGYLSKGNHGYEKDHTDMHGIFIAQGPAFKEHYKTGTLWNVDIYPLLSKIFGIKQNSLIDGKLERIEFILREN